MSSEFKPTQAVKKTNRQLAEKNADVHKQLRTIGTAPHWLTDNKNNKVFPAPYVDSSLIDQADRYQIKQKLAREAGDVDRGAWYTTVPLTDSDVEFVIKQSELEELLEYDKQFLALVDVTNASELERFREIYPAFFEKRKEYCRQIVKMQVALAKIALMGVQSKADLDLVINIQAQQDGGKRLMELLAVPVHYLVLANSDDFLHNGEKWQHPARTGAPEPYGVRNVPYKNKTGNLKKIGAGWFPDTARDADQRRYNAYGGDQDTTARGALEEADKYSWFSTYMQRASLV